MFILLGKLHIRGRIMSNPIDPQKREILSRKTDAELSDIWARKAEYPDDVVQTVRALLEERLGSVPELSIAVNDTTQTRQDYGFNFGAFFITPLWLLFHGRVGTGVLLIVLNFISRAAVLLGEGGVFSVIIIQMFIMFYFGTTGNRIAWEKKGYASREELKEGERGWNIAGILIGISIVIPLTLISLFSVM